MDQVSYCTEVKLRGNDSDRGFHGWVNAAVVCKYPGLGKCKSICIAFRKADGTPGAVVSKDVVRNSVIVGPGDGCTSGYGQGVWNEREIGYRHIHISRLGGWFWGDWCGTGFRPTGGQQYHRQ